MDAGGYNGNKRAVVWRLGMGQQRGVEKENKSTLSTERCENIKNMYIIKKCYKILKKPTFIQLSIGNDAKA